MVETSSSSVSSIRKEQLESRIKSRRQLRWESITLAEVSALVEDALVIGENTTALHVVESVVATCASPARFTLLPLKRIMIAASRRQDLVIGDAAIAIALADRMALLDAEIVGHYVELLAGLEVSLRASQ